MPGEKEIRSKIASVKNMQKITSAMEKVAASKIRKAQKQMEASRPYARRIRRVIGHLAHANPDYKHPFLIEREVSRVGFIVISTDRGLCGGLNANLFKTTIGEIAEWQEKNVEVDLALIGAKAVAFFKRMGGNVLGTATHLGDQPHVNDLLGAITIMLNAYSDGKIDRLYVVHNEFRQHHDPAYRAKSARCCQRAKRWTRMSSTTCIGTIIYEPDAADLLDDVLDALHRVSGLPGCR